MANGFKQLNINYTFISTELQELMLKKKTWMVVSAIAWFTIMKLDISMLISDERKKKVVFTSRKYKQVHQTGDFQLLPLKEAQWYLWGRDSQSINKLLFVSINLAWLHTSRSTNQRQKHQKVIIVLSSFLISFQVAKSIYNKRFG